MRNHVGAKPPRLATAVEQALDIKPRGVWYSVRGSWHDWASAELPERVRPHLAVWDIGLNRGATSRIKTIRSAADVVAFGDRFGRRARGAPWQNIDWRSVAMEYDGVEVRGYGRTYRGLASEASDDLATKHLWFASIDCDSGCVWNPTALGRVERAGSVRDFA